MDESALATHSMPPSPSIPEPDGGRLDTWKTVRGTGSAGPKRALRLDITKVRGALGTFVTPTQPVRTNEPTTAARPPLRCCTSELQTHRRIEGKYISKVVRPIQLGQVQKPEKFVRAAHAFITVR